MIVPGAFLYLLSSISKHLLSNTNKDDGTRLIFAFKIDFMKGNVFSAFSVLQLLGVLWVATGVIRLLASAQIDNFPDTAIFAVEMLVPLGLSFLIAYIKMKN